MQRSESPFLQMEVSGSPFLDAEAFREPEADTAGPGPQQRVEQELPRDEVDSFLASRRSLYKVALVGTHVQVTLSRSHEWTGRYTRRALSEGAVGAALNALFVDEVTPQLARQAWDKLVGHGVKFEPAGQAADKAPVYTLLMDEPALRKWAEALKLRMPGQMHTAWRVRLCEARMLQFAVHQLRDTFDSLVPHFASTDLVKVRLSAAFIQELLKKRAQDMVEEAKRHPATAWWRQAFKQNRLLHAGEREPTLADFPVVPQAQWAHTLVQLAAATRNTLRLQLARSILASRKEARNRHLSPHELPVSDAARFILENFEPSRSERLHTTGWEIHGGQQLVNIRNQRIFLLRVDSDRVVFQNLADRKFYQQTLEGFGEEQLYSIYAMAGRKAYGAIVLGKWVLGLAGAVFPAVRVGLLAFDVLNAAIKLQANRAELERHYEGLKLAYANIDALLPGVLPKVWDAVLDKRNVALFNPLKNPDLGAWLKVIIRLVMQRYSRVVSPSLVAAEVSGFLKKAWAAIAKGLKALQQVVGPLIVMAPAIAGSTGVSGQRALEMAQERLKEIGVADAVLIVAQIRRLARADQDRLSREIRDGLASGTQLLDVVKKSMSW